MKDSKVCCDEITTTHPFIQKSICCARGLNQVFNH